MTPAAFDRLEALGDRLRARLGEVFRRRRRARAGDRRRLPLPAALHRTGRSAATATWTRRPRRRMERSVLRAPRRGRAGPHRAGWAASRRRWATARSRRSRWPPSGRSAPSAAADRGPPAAAREARCCGPTRRWAAWRDPAPVQLDADRARGSGASIPGHPPRPVRRSHLSRGRPSRGLERLASPPGALAPRRAVRRGARGPQLARRGGDRPRGRAVGYPPEWSFALDRERARVPHGRDGHADHPGGLRPRRPRVRPAGRAPGGGVRGGLAAARVSLPLSVPRRPHGAGAHAHADGVREPGRATRAPSPTPAPPSAPASRSRSSRRVWW